MNDLKLIKRHYGEKMMHLCRSLFPTILQEEGLLYSILTKRFYPGEFLYDDIIENKWENKFSQIIYNLYDKIKNEENKEDKAISFNSDTGKITSKTPFELLRSKGYTLYQCKTEDDIQSFKKYYAPGEELCTFKGGRLKSCFVFFAVKDNAENIKRKSPPERQDEYGTSVISIQFPREKFNNPSIKNRYNHSVPDPDATFSNNLDEIVEGLTDSFCMEYNLNIDSSLYEVELPGYVIANDGRYYKYTHEQDNIYTCPDNIIIKDFSPIFYDKARYIFFDQYILDLHEKTINNFYYYSDSFVNSIGKLDKDEDKIIVSLDKETGNRIISIKDDIVININRKHELIGYSNPYITKLKRGFLEDCNTIEVLNVPKVKNIEGECLVHATGLKVANFESVEKIGISCLRFNRNIKKLVMPMVIEIGSNFMSENYVAECIYLPKLEHADAFFLENCSSLKKLYSPNLRMIRYGYASYNYKIHDYIDSVVNSHGYNDIYHGEEVQRNMRGEKTKKYIEKVMKPYKNACK